MCETVYEFQTCYYSQMVIRIQYTILLQHGGWDSITGALHCNSWELSHQRINQYTRIVPLEWPHLRRFAGTKLCIYVRKKTYTEAAVDKPCIMGGTSTGAAVTSGKANVGMSLVNSGVIDAVMLERVGCELRMPDVDIRLCTEDWVVQSQYTDIS